MEEDRVFVTTKHLFVACGHSLVCPSPRPGGQCVPGLFEFRPDSSSDNKEVSGVFGTSFCCCKIPPVHAAQLEGPRLRGCSGHGAPGVMEAALGQAPPLGCCRGVPECLGNHGHSSLTGTKHYASCPVSSCPFISRIIWGWPSPFNWHKFSWTQLDLFFLFLRGREGGI